MNFDSVAKIAAAILYEGYILYPYRPTAIKNRQRWNFGTLYPRIYAEAQCSPEPFSLVAECILFSDTDATLDVKISFLQHVRQPPSVPTLDSEGLNQLADPSLAWDEAIERSFEHHNISLCDLIAARLTLTMQISIVDLPQCQEASTSPTLEAIVTIGVEVLHGQSCKLHVELENVSSLPNSANAKRDEALLRSFVSTHVLIGITSGEFISLLDPGESYQKFTATCRNVGVFPVLAGEEPDRSMMLCSPIILYDYPKIAPESAGDFFDGTEMDEMLTLRVLTLTDAEKEEMRNVDPRARNILERTESLTAESILKAHGVIHGLRDIRDDAP
jgi:hypothetical protein